MTNKDLLESCTVKKATFLVPSLGKEVLLRQLTIDEVQKLRELSSDKKTQGKDVIYQTLKYAMVEPTFFDKKELVNLTPQGERIILEIYQEVPLIGKNKKQRKQYFKLIEKLSKKEPQETKVEEKK